MRRPTSIGRGYPATCITRHTRKERPCMKQREQALLFIKKACQDEALPTEIVFSKAVSDETFGFHCQQAAEKLLKAILSFYDIDFARTHNLRASSWISLPTPRH